MKMFPVVPHQELRTRKPEVARAIERQIEETRRMNIEWTTTAVSPVHQEVIDGFIVTWTFDRHEGGYVVRSVTLEPKDASAEVTAALLRKLSPSRALAEVAARALRNA